MMLQTGNLNSTIHHKKGDDADWIFPQQLCAPNSSDHILDLLIKQKKNKRKKKYFENWGPITKMCKRWRSDERHPKNYYYINSTHQLFHHLRKENVGQVLLIDWNTSQLTKVYTKAKSLRAAAPHGLVSLL